MIKPVGLVKKVVIIALFKMAKTPIKTIKAFFQPIVLLITKFNPLKKLKNTCPVFIIQPKSLLIPSAINSLFFKMKLLKPLMLWFTVGISLIAIWVVRDFKKVLLFLILVWYSFACFISAFVISKSLFFSLFSSLMLLSGFSM